MPAGRPRTETAPPSLAGRSRQTATARCCEQSRRHRRQGAGRCAFKSAGSSSNVPAVHRVRACLRWVPSHRRARSSGRGGTGRRASLRCSWAITRPVEVRLLSTAFSKPPCRNQADEAQVQLLASRSINRSPTGGVAQPGRAPASHAGSRGFKSRRLHPLSGVRDRAGKPAGRRSASRRSDPMPAPMV